MEAERWTNSNARKLSCRGDWTWVSDRLSTSGLEASNFDESETARSVVERELDRWLRIDQRIKRRCIAKTLMKDSYSREDRRHDRSGTGAIDRWGSTLSFFFQRPQMHLVLRLVVATARYGTLLANTEPVVLIEPCQALDIPCFGRCEWGQRPLLVGSAEALAMHRVWDPWLGDSARKVRIGRTGFTEYQEMKGPRE